MYKILILNDDLKKSFKNHDLGYEEVEYEKIVFNSGESHFKIKNPESLDNTKSLIIVTKLKSAQDILDLAVAVDAFENIGSGAEIHLLIGYLPAARQDRIWNPGESLSAKVYSNIIDSLCEWKSIQYIDAHSNVMPALLGGRSINNFHFVDRAIEAIDLEDEFTLILPDEKNGANKKVFLLELIQNLNNQGKNIEVVRTDKKRDLTTGNILETIVFTDDLTNKDCVLVDDICDGGRTFIELAKVLKQKGARNVILMVTHGIFSKGCDVVLEHVDQIVTTNSFVDLSDDNGDSVTVVGLDLSYYDYK